MVVGTVQGAAVGRSTRRNAFNAGHEAAVRALEGLGGARPALVVVHATTGYDQERLVAGVAHVTGSAPMTGCSGEGVISRDGADEGSHTVVVMAIAVPGVQFTTLSVPDAIVD